LHDDVLIYLIGASRDHYERENGMNHIIGAILLMGLLYGTARADETTGNSHPLNEEKDRVSYSVGYQMGQDFRSQNTDISPEAFLKGIEDAMADAEPAISPEDMRSTLLEMKKKILALQEEKKRAQQNELKKMREKHLREGREFLAANAKKEGVITLPSGLQYTIIKEGTGRMPGAIDTVKVQYRGMMIDGTEFDSSYAKGAPATFKVDGLIKGWTEALQLMKEGAQWQLFIPPDLAYSERGPLADKTLIFDVELLSVESPD
jgi:FKBP-type peptidyl-prolyl cis-trans isomerase FklB